jgi:CubicO group peptidase (beta-lactamase class C family)
MRRVLAVAAVSFAMLSPGACSRARGESQAARVDKLFAAWDKNDSPGCAVGVSRNGATVYEHGYGMANLELGVPITPSTVFAIASITKAFTAMSTLLAADQHKLSLDDEVQKYIPDWQDRDDHITVRHLLTHTSGIRDAFALLGWAPGDPNADVNEAIVRILSRQRGLNSAPGSEYMYNNGGYNLLASILKRATGQSLGQFAGANIFTPLGMAHTHVQEDAGALVPNRAYGYTRDAGGWRGAKADGGVVGNAGMYSTVGDLLRWAENFDRPRVGSQAMLDSMRTPLVLPSGPSPEHGVGFGLGEYRGVPTVSTSGGDHGIATEVARFPTQHFSVAVLCNEDNIVMGGMARLNPDVFINGIADIYLADALKPVDAAAPPLPSARSAASVKLTDAELTEKTGLYRIGGVDFPVQMTVKNGVLVGRSLFGDEFDLELAPKSANRFLLYNSVPFEFVSAGAGKTKQWRVGEGKDQRIWELVTLALSPAELRAFGGDYRSDELNITYAVEPKGSGLNVAHNVDVAPYEKDVFVGDWVGIMKFTRDARGAVSGFTVNRANAKGVRFDRITR